MGNIGEPVVTHAGCPGRDSQMPPSVSTAATAWSSLALERSNVTCKAASRGENKIGRRGRTGVGAGGEKSCGFGVLVWSK